MKAPIEVAKECGATDVIGGSTPTLRIHYGVAFSPTALQAFAKRIRNEAKDEMAKECERVIAAHKRIQEIANWRAK